MNAKQEIKEIKKMTEIISDNSLSDEVRRKAWIKRDKLVRK